MKKLVLIIAVASILFACNNSKKEESKEETKLTQTEEENVESQEDQSQLYGIESACIKYKDNVAGMEMDREWCFDQYGNRQFEKSSMEMMGQKIISYTIILDGHQYKWDEGEKTGTKSKYYYAVTDYENVLDKDIEKYGIVKHGYEEVLGKKCLKVSIEEPAKTTSWTWNNITLKTISNVAGMNTTIEAYEIAMDNVDASLFQLPEDVTFE